MYFVTINTHNREHSFGEIVNDEMEFSSLGIIANKYWNAIPEYHPFAELNTFTVMPNHIHGLVIINKPFEVPPLDAIARYGPQSGNLAAIIRGYKSSVTSYARQEQLPFRWQARFHDHIVRDEEEYMKIYNYIINNPRNWKDDRFY